MLGVKNQRAGRDMNDQIIAAEPGHFFPHAALAALGSPMMAAGKVEKRIFIGIGDHDDAAAVAAIASVRPALGDIFFASEGNTSVAPIARFDLDDGFVNEHGNRKVRREDADAKEL
jgi:hypothetical protein